MQLETSQRTYMDEASATFDPVSADRLQPVLEALLRAAMQPAR